ncbi:NAD(P)-dependent dehydrogenase (short-subunit alcohol dehydrogenase family) [Erwinia persicina]|jgi:NAD(P)-dependent dehydrogenase (short-subunit alcohol dehydrogenase family)|uniref:SDR family oxidoreductase n=2 Tax=Erwinia TaxID=551 RepID=A0ABV4E4J3_9GAMM|nr:MULTISPECIES: SDR family oxidoreductase [Erwinia]MCP1437609.1 NAD(P)-dependent dehydrogenase (short-subunit alcohol dehydrogenase family) [Erwinia persicina]MDN4626520.1 SDR family oxidoreductase [Erwinia sp. PsM31]MDN8540975.1 SDR family oxidoreductase [Erwinia sp. BC051422]
MSKAEQKVAVVTASDSGIGKASAIMLAEQGYDIGITWRSDEKGAQDTAERVRALGRRAEIQHLDLADPQEGGKALEALISKLGRIDALVNNAGTNDKSPFLETSFDSWRKVFTVDVDGAFICGQIAARHMVEQGEGGRIVNITSVHEHTPLPDSTAYTAAKHALGGLTKSMALSLMPHNILVNSVAPGAIATPMNDMSDDDARNVSIPEIPAGRPGDPREIASMVAWLCSEWASYTTGQSFVIDGGFTLANPQFYIQK